MVGIRRAADGVLVQQIVAELRDVVEQQTRGQFTIGDRALEIEPMRQRGGPVAEPEYTVEQSMKRLADDIGLSVATGLLGAQAAHETLFGPDDIGLKRDTAPL